VRKSPEIPRDVFFGAGAEEAPAAAATPLRAGRAVDEAKVQVTVYLSEAAAKRLEALRFHLLNDHNLKVPKSAIAEYAITALSDDLAPLVTHFSRSR